VTGARNKLPWEEKSVPTGVKSGDASTAAVMDTSIPTIVGHIELVAMDTAADSIAAADATMEDVPLPEPAIEIAPSTLNDVLMTTEELCDKIWDALADD
jgi:hypothetical protein